MRTQDRSWLVVCLAASAALVTVACEGGRTPASPSANAAVSLSSASQAPKVDVCHAEANGSFHLIDVSGNALSAHLAHGDAQPGDAVPGVKGKRFDEACNQVDISVSCPCWTEKSLPPPPANQCFDALPGSLTAEFKGSHYILDVRNSFCAVKSGDPALRVDPTAITAAEAKSCLALLQPLCSGKSTEDPAPPK
jgi:hypothetical protein